MDSETKTEPAELGQQTAFACPHCNCPVQAIYPQRYDAGEKVRCPACFGLFVIPEK